MEKRPRLSPDACKSSVYARDKALRDALRAIDQAPKALLAACGSAVTLAELELPDLGITRLGSRNTLFKYADLVLGDSRTPEGESGWAYLDWLRREVKKAASQATGKQSKAARQARAKVRQVRTRDELEALERTMAAQSKAYLWLLRGVSGIARGDARDADEIRQRLFNVLNQHDELFGGLFGVDVAEAVRPDNIRRIK